MPERFLQIGVVEAVGEQLQIAASTMRASREDLASRGAGISPCPAPRRLVATSSVCISISRSV